MVSEGSGQAQGNTQRIKCPECDVLCEPYGHYKTVGVCPKCHKHFTTADASNPDIIAIRLDEGADKIDRVEHRY